MSPEAIISILARLNLLLEAKYKEQRQKFQKFKQLQLMLVVVSSSMALILFLLYHAPVLQMLFVLAGFNVLFYIGFKPRSHYTEKKVKELMQQVVHVQVALRRYSMGEEVSFDGVRCSSEEGWNFDKWGLYKDDERIDYGEFLYANEVKGLYLEALRNKK